MWVRITSTVLLLVGFGQPAPGDAPKGELAALEQKLVGAWDGQGGCDGKFVFRTDGSYALTGHGPGGDDTKGTWKLRWDALPPTLVLTCTGSGIPDEVGKARELKLVRLDDKNLTVRYPHPDGGLSGEYVRAKK